MKTSLAFLLVISGAVAFGPQPSCSVARSRVRTRPEALNFAGMFGAPTSKKKSAPPPEKAALLKLIQEMEATGGSRGSKSTVDQGIQLTKLIDSLAASNPNPEAVREPGRPALVGNWKLIYTARSNLGLESKEWLQYLVENGPSPIQRFVIGSVAQVGRVYQTLELDDTGGSFNNFIDFRDALGGVLNLQATVEGYTGGTQLDIRFSNAYFLFDRNPLTGELFKEKKRLPYPVPFRLLPNESRGLLDNFYVDEGLRLARGNKGTVFILVKDNEVELPKGSD